MAKGQEEILHEIMRKHAEVRRLWDEFNPSVKDSGRQSCAAHMATVCMGAAKESLGVYLEEILKAARRPCTDGMFDQDSMYGTLSAREVKAVIDSWYTKDYDYQTARDLASEGEGEEGDPADEPAASGQDIYLDLAAATSSVDGDAHGVIPWPAEIELRTAGEGQALHAWATSGDPSLATAPEWFTSWRERFEAAPAHGSAIADIKKIAFEWSGEPYSFEDLAGELDDGDDGALLWAMINTGEIRLSTGHALDRYVADEEFLHLDLPAMLEAHPALGTEAGTGDESIDWLFIVRDPDPVDESFAEVIADWIGTGSATWDEIVDRFETRSETGTIDGEHVMATVRGMVERRDLIDTGDVLTVSTQDVADDEGVVDELDEMEMEMLRVRFEQATGEEPGKRQRKTMSKMIRAAEAVADELAGMGLADLAERYKTATGSETGLPVDRDDITKAILAAEAE